MLICIIFLKKCFDTMTILFLFKQNIYYFFHQVQHKSFNYFN